MFNESLFYNGYPVKYALMDVIGYNGFGPIVEKTNSIVAKVAMPCFILEEKVVYPIKYDLKYYTVLFNRGGKDFEEEILPKRGCSGDVVTTYIYDTYEAALIAQEAVNDSILKSIAKRVGYEIEDEVDAKTLLDLSIYNVSKYTALASESLVNSQFISNKTRE